MNFRSKSAGVCLVILCLCVSVVPSHAVTYTDGSVLTHLAGSFTITSVIKTRETGDEGNDGKQFQRLKLIEVHRIQGLVARINMKIKWYENYPNSRGAVALKQTMNYERVRISYSITVPNELAPGIEQRIRRIVKIKRYKGASGSIRFRASGSQSSAPFE